MIHYLRVTIAYLYFSYVKMFTFFLPTALYQTTSQPLTIKPTMPSERLKTTMGNNFLGGVHCLFNLLIQKHFFKKKLVLCYDIS